MRLNQETIRKMIQDGERLDGRGMEEFREIELETDYVNETAEGSAYVRMGDTQVVVGLKVGVEEPYSDRPDQGTMVTNAELAPMADREYESGPPQEPGVELARVVDRGIRESEAIDLEALCIEEGEKVLTLFVDVHVLNDDGNLIDASSLGALAALKSGFIPVYDEEADELVRDEKEMDVPMSNEPVTVTGHKIDGEIVWDTTGDEEEARDARLTVSMNEDENVVAMQKGDRHAFSQDEVMHIVEKAEQKSGELRDQLEEAVGE